MWARVNTGVPAQKSLQGDRTPIAPLPTNYDYPTSSIGFICGGGFISSFVSMAIYGADPLFMVHQMISLGMSLTEASCVVISFVPSIWAFIVFYALLLKMEAPLNEFCSEFAQLHESFAITKEHLQGIFDNLRLRQIFPVLFAISSSVLFSIGWNDMKPQLLNDEFYTGLMWIFFIVDTLAILTPLEIISQFLILQCIRALSLALRQFERNWRVEELNDTFLLEASKLTRLIDILNKCVGPTIFSVFAICLYTLVFNIFYGFLTLTAFQGEKVMTLVLFIGLASNFWGLWNVSKISSYIKYGRELSRSMDCMKNDLQSYYIQHAVSLGEYEKALIHTLMDKYSKSSAIQPLGTFDLSISTGIGMAAWLVTNLIVLLQFRGGEEGSALPSINGNCTQLQ